MESQLDTQLDTKISFITLENEYFKFNAITFIPNEVDHNKVVAVFSHGYTACKNDNFSWAQRLSDANIPCIIFDLPGHYLGSLYEVESFESFKEHAHECFLNAYQKLVDMIDFMPEKIVLGGHSLGAMLSLKALEFPEFENAIAIGIGLGISQHKETHLFETSFYQKTLNIRRQLVSPALGSENVFPWIKDEKISYALEGKRIHLITGADDVVVGQGGMEALEFMLKNMNNEVTTQEPKKLPHHEPSLASSHIFHFLKKEFNL